MAELFRGREGIDEVLVGDQRARYDLDHERAGEVVLISDAQQLAGLLLVARDDRAPTFARTVDIHRKPGYDPVELHFDLATKSIPLDATLVKGSHGAPAATTASAASSSPAKKACSSAPPWPTPTSANWCRGSLGFRFRAAAVCRAGRAFRLVE